MRKIDCTLIISYASSFSSQTLHNELQSDYDAGYIRAYGPTLSTHSSLPGPLFHAVLKRLHDAAQASPLFDIVLVASGLAGMYPGWIALAVEGEQGAREGEWGGVWAEGVVCDGGGV